MHYSIDLQISPYSRVLEALRQVVSRPENILTSVGESLLNANQERHTRGVAPDGTPWAPLARSTLYRAVENQQHRVTSAGNKRRGATSDFAKAQKIMGNKAARILYQYGDLLRFAYQVSNGQLRVGTNDKKGRVASLWHRLIWASRPALHHSSTGQKSPGVRWRCLRASHTPWHSGPPAHRLPCI
jgi:hypothetical protein